MVHNNLIGGLEHDFYDFSIQLGMSSSQLANSIKLIFFRGVGWNHQPFYGNIVG